MNYLIDDNKNLIPSEKVSVPNNAILFSTNWVNKSQTAIVSGVTANNTIIVTPIPNDLELCAESKIICSAQSSNSLTFTCKTVPVRNVSMGIVIVG